MKTITKTVLAIILLAASGSAFAQEPVQNIDAQRHGNIAAAQDLVRQANVQIRLAADAANLG